MSRGASCPRALGSTRHLTVKRRPWYLTVYGESLVSREELLVKLRALAESDDSESAHADADVVLVTEPIANPRRCDRCDKLIGREGPPLCGACQDKRRGR